MPNILARSGRNPGIFELTDFRSKISELVYMHDISFIDAVIKLAEDENYELEYLAGVIRKNPFLFASIEKEAVSLNFLPKPDLVGD